MKLMCLLLAALLSCAASAQIANLRMVGTNLYDFTHAGNAFIVGGSEDRPARIVKRYPKSAKVEIYADMAEWLPNPYWDGGPLNQFYIRETFRIHDSAYAAAAGRPAKAGSWVFYTSTNTIYILNPPPSLPCMAVPTSTPGFYDCGVPFHGDSSQFRYIYRLWGPSIYRQLNKS